MASKIFAVLIALAISCTSAPSASADDPTPTPTPSPTSTTQSKRSVGVTLSVSGQRLVDCQGWHEVAAGRVVTFTAAVPETGVVRFHWYSTDSAGGWYKVGTYDRALNAGKAELRTTAVSSGVRRISAEFLGNETTFSAVSVTRSIRYVTVPWTRLSNGGVKLKVPFYRQQYNLTCESASARQALNFYGHNVSSDLTVLNKIGVDARSRSGGKWGDPELAFVGKYNGWMMRDGYGVHATPVQKAITKHWRSCRPAIEVKIASDRQIAGYLDQGFPVELWGAYKGNKGVFEYRWTSWAGRAVSAWSVEHTWLIVGFAGPSSNPSGFYVHDPSNGRYGGAFLYKTRADIHSFSRYFATPSTSRVVVIR